MCFSTEASFGAALILGSVGYVTTKTSNVKNLYLLASIPFLFAMQQLCEGIIWYNFSYHPIPKDWLKIAVNLYLIFAFLIWPVWIPLSLLVAEKVLRNRMIISIDLACGIALSLLNLVYAIKADISVQTMNHSIQYHGHMPSQLYLYPVIVLLPCFFSSLKNMFWFGILVAIAFVVANYFYQTTFVSVWCFFSAIVSLLIYKILRDNQTDSEKNISKNSL